MAGYQRQDTANKIANGNVIDADDFDAEYNAVEAAFNASTGHKHDGTTGEGAPITKVGPSQDIIVSATNVNPKTTNTLDLGVSAGVKFKDGYFQGTLVGETAVKAGTNRYMTLTDNELDVSTGDLTIDVEGDIVIDANGGDITLKDDGTTFGGISNASGQTVIKSGATPTTAITFSDADATLAGNTTLSGTLDVTGDINFNSTTTSTTKTTGAVIIDGGVGIAENVNIGGDVAIDGDLTVSGVGKNITGDLIGDVKSTDGTSVLDSGTDGTDATFTGAVTGNASTATTWETAREIALTGDVTGTVTGVNGSGNISITTTIAADSVALGTDTTGNYMAGVSAGTGVTVTHTPSEGSTATIAIGQAVSTTSDVTFNDVTVSGDLTVSGTTTTVNTETINLADNQIVLNSNETGTPSQNGGIEIERGTETNKTLLWYENAAQWSVGSETFEAGTFKGNLTKASDLTISATGTGDITLDAAGDIILDADANAQVIFKDGGTNKFLFDGLTGSIQTYTGDLSIRTTTSGAVTLQSVGSAKDVTLDSANDVILDATTGVTKLYRGGTQLAQLDTGSTYGDPLKISTSATSTGTMTESLWVDQYGVNVLYGLRVGDSSNPTEDDIYAVGDIQAGGNMTCTTSNVTTIDFGDWTITESAGVLYFATGGTNKMKLDASGNLTVTGNVTAYGTV